MAGMTSGVMPDRNAVRDLAEEMGDVNDRWRVVLTRFQLSSDFQQLELFKLTEARLAENGFSFPEMQEAMAWQVRVRLYGFGFRVSGFGFRGLLYGLESVERTNDERYPWISRCVGFGSWAAAAASCALVVALVGGMLPLLALPNAVLSVMLRVCDEQLLLLVSERGR
jgi:hypothetical protein